MTTDDAPLTHARTPAPAAPSVFRRPESGRGIDWRKRLPLLAGVGLFCLLYFCPWFSDAIDPQGRRFPLTYEGRAALALFALAVVWWSFEVVPLGVTSIALGALQSLLLVRPAKAALGDFMDPSIWFILGAIVISMAFSRTGLTNRMVYAALTKAGERTSMIYLSSFAITAGLTLIMPHTVAAATVYPLLMSIHALYVENGESTKFGKGLFIGMAFTAGAGSMATLLGSARAAVAVGFFREMAGRDVMFFEFACYMLPLAAVMVLVIWALCMLLFKPERATIPGLQGRARTLYQRLGPITPAEILLLLVVGAALAAMGLQWFLPLGEPLDKTTVVLSAATLLFLFGILTIKDLEQIPWNIVLLFGGAMSIGLCLWQTGAAHWLAVQGLGISASLPAVAFVVGVAGFVLLAANFVVNIATIALALPIALAAAPYLRVAPEVILFAILAAAGMPLLRIAGAAPSAIASESRQFSPREFLLAGIPATLLVVCVLALFVWLVWPLLGMPVTPAPATLVSPS